MSKTMKQMDYSKSWDKENMLYVHAKYKKEFVEEFRSACKLLNRVQSQIFKDAMQQTIDDAEIYQDIAREVTWATSSKTIYDLETHLPCSGDYDSEVHEYINQLEGAFNDDDAYKLIVADLIDYYFVNRDEYEF